MTLTIYDKDLPFFVIATYNNVKKLDILSVENTPIITFLTESTENKELKMYSIILDKYKTSITEE